MSMKRLLMILLFLTACASAQVTYSVLIPANPPGGAGASCSTTAVAYLAPSGTIYTCQSGTWQSAGGGSATSITINSTTVTGGTPGDLLGVASGPVLTQNTLAGWGIAATGVDINTSNQVTATHLASPLPIAQGGTGATTLAGANIALTGQANAFGSFLQSMGQLAVGPSNTSLGTATASILDRTATTGATSVYIGSDNNGHTSATTTSLTVVAGASQGTTTIQQWTIDSIHNVQLSNSPFSLGNSAWLLSGGSGFNNFFIQPNSEFVVRPNGINTLIVNTTGTVLSAVGATITGDTNLCWQSGNPLTQGSVCGTSLAIYKQNIQPVEHGLDYVMRMRPVTFDWKKDGKSDLGLIADEVAAIDPLMGAYRANGDLYNFKDRAVLATLIKAVQEIETQIQGLKARQ